MKKTDTETVVTPVVKKTKTLVGKVMSTSMTNTVVVAVIEMRRHPLYRNTMKTTHRHAAHVEGMEVKVGQMVRIAEVKPISRTKHFIVTELVK